MKILPTLFLNLALVSVGLATYHVATAPVADDGDTAALDGLEQRIAAIEERIEALGNRRTDRHDQARTTDLLERLTSLERRLVTGDTAENGEPGEATDGAAAAFAGTDAETDGPGGTDPLVGEGAGEGEGELQRVRKLMDKVEEQRQQERAVARVDAMLERLAIQLTATQKERLAKELDAARDSMRERMREAFQNGGGREEMLASHETVRAELTETLTEFIPATDAEAIAASARFGPGGPGGGGGGFGGGRR